MRWPRRQYARECRIRDFYNARLTAERPHCATGTKTNPLFDGGHAHHSRRQSPKQVGIQDPCGLSDSPALAIPEEIRFAVDMLKLSVELVTIPLCVEQAEFPSHQFGRCTRNTMSPA
jgi:hypothetical protein